MIHRFGQKTGLSGGLIFGVVMVGIILTVGHDYARSQNHNSDNAAQIVVIDPGHGGYDTGVTGPSGTMEKDVNLAVARLMAAGLGVRGYRAYLVRTGDYNVDLVDRTAKANRTRADLFVSLHCGGGFAHQNDGADIFYIGEAASVNDGSALSTSPVFQSVGGGVSHASWDRINEKHVRANRAVATQLQQSLSDLYEEALIGKTVHQGRAGLTETRLAVLEGANMPAVLIEVGCLSNPAVEGRLQGPDFLKAAAERMCNAIDRFFKNLAGN